MRAPKRQRQGSQNDADSATTYPNLLEAKSDHRIERSFTTGPPEQKIESPLPITTSTGTSGWTPFHARHTFDRSERPIQHAEAFLIVADFNNRFEPDAEDRSTTEIQNAGTTPHIKQEVKKALRLAGNKALIRNINLVVCDARNWRISGRDFEKASGKKDFRGSCPQHQSPLVNMSRSKGANDRPELSDTTDDMMTADTKAAIEKASGKKDFQGFWLRDLEQIVETRRLPSKRLQARRISQVPRYRILSRLSRNFPASRSRRPGELGTWDWMICPALQLSRMLEGRGRSQLKQVVDHHSLQRNLRSTAFAKPAASQTIIIPLLMCAHPLLSNIGDAPVSRDFPLAEVIHYQWIPTPISPQKQYSEVLAEHFAGKGEAQGDGIGERAARANSRRTYSINIELNINYILLNNFSQHPSRYTNRRDRYERHSARRSGEKEKKVAATDPPRIGVTDEMWLLIRCGVFITDEIGLLLMRCRKMDFCIYGLSSPSLMARRIGNAGGRLGYGVLGSGAFNMHIGVRRNDEPSKPLLPRRYRHPRSVVLTNRSDPNCLTRFIQLQSNPLVLEHGTNIGRRSKITGSFLQMIRNMYLLCASRNLAIRMSSLALTHPHTHLGLTCVNEASIVDMASTNTCDAGKNAFGHFPIFKLVSKRHLALASTSTATILHLHRLDIVESDSDALNDIETMHVEANTGKASAAKKTATKTKTNTGKPQKGPAATSAVEEKAPVVLGKTLQLRHNCTKEEGHRQEGDSKEDRDSEEERDSKEGIACFPLPTCTLTPVFTRLSATRNHDAYGRHTGGLLIQSSVQDGRESRAREKTKHSVPTPSLANSPDAAKIVGAVLIPNMIDPSLYFPS
ncbi:uncharacterized protein MYCFIDRAFT_180653 [Pseudocercospora fijiensis CIRAD86]|uniref:Uncharacterized protein n=1 Tax=Pseudocercospora fijiensis (strain CIRAD86) TaxID=383855 RepID=M2ZCK2_PSEFD|nr:uncharacterized protein MYCFIDRAFT_180653 [Pseudocercospora fijiensis CIRAD86]EME76834.1 hypothetical protein MYCFIDRAFT_180653 [Pseudocercospora fijiensis CIRAD86]